MVDDDKDARLSLVNWRLAKLEAAVMSMEDKIDESVTSFEGKLKTAASGLEGQIDRMNTKIDKRREADDRQRIITLYSALVAAGGAIITCLLTIAKMAMAAPVPPGH